MSTSHFEILKSFRKNTEWFDNKYQSLKKYDGQFIAMHRETIVDPNLDPEALAEAQKELNQPSNDG